jgi:hypothetical protein
MEIQTASVASLGSLHTVRRNCCTGTQADPTLARYGTDLVATPYTQADPTLPRYGTDLVALAFLTVLLRKA